MPKLTLTPDMLENAYEYLRVSPPFCRWSLRKLAKRVCAIHGFDPESF